MGANAYDELKILGFDHLEIAVADLERACEPFLKLGFEKSGTRVVHERQLRSFLLVQNGVQIVLSQSLKTGDPLSSFVAAHGDGVFSIGFLCEDAVTTLELVAGRGATVLEAPRSQQREEGTIHQATIASFADVRHTFISRTGTLFAEGFDFIPKTSTKGVGLREIDHVTSYLEKGQTPEVVEFYAKIFGLTGVVSSFPTVLESEDRKVRLLFHEPQSSAAPIQDYLDIHHGAGVQHAALGSSDLRESVRSLKKHGVKFLEIPRTYYDELPQRVPGISENLNELSELGIMSDGDRDGYLLHSFTEALLGPFHLELIQRKGNYGFGERNVRALYEAMERDRVQRGVLNHTPAGSSPAEA